MKPLLDAKAASQKDYDDAVSAEEVAAADVKGALSVKKTALLGMLVGLIVFIGGAF